MAAVCVCVGREKARIFSLAHALSFTGGFLYVCVSEKSCEQHISNRFSREEMAAAAAAAA
jgi:hypothetical protein